MKKLALLYIVLLIITGCEKKLDDQIIDNLPIDTSFCDNFPLENSTLKDSVDYAIINSVLECFYTNEDSIHFKQSTNYGVGIENIEMTLSYRNIDFDSSLLSDYKTKNTNSYILTDSLLSKSVTLISQQELTCIFNFEDAGWEKYYEKYPKSGGFLYFYRPGINMQGNKAIVEYGHFINYLGAMGFIVVLEKTNNNWNITHRINTWISK